MKITLDSNEPLEDALRVVGAMYNVDLIVPLEQQDQAETVAKNPAGKPATKRASTEKQLAEPRPARSSASGAAKTARDTKRKRVARKNGSPGNAEVRSWARQNGMTVKDRGRLPASIVVAYRSANTK